MEIAKDKDGNGWRLLGMRARVGHYRRTPIASYDNPTVVENGRDYYKLEGQQLREPIEPLANPLKENLEYHAYNVFR